MNAITKNIVHSAVAALLAGIAVACTPAEAANTAESSIPVRAMPEIRGEEKAILTKAPAVPAPITRDYATKVIV